MSIPTDFTPEQLEDLFHSALKVGDAKGVEATLRALLAVDPRRAIRLHDDLRTAIRVAPFIEHEHVAPSGQFCAPTATPKASS